MPDAPPDRKTWLFRDPATGEQREYIQRELTIDGEVALLTLVSKGVERLTAKGFPWADLRALIEQADTDNPLGSIDWSKAQVILATALSEVPELGAEAAAIFVGVSPAHSGDVAFIRGSLKLARLIDMARLFAQQNEYDRLLAPLTTAMSRSINEAIKTVGPPKVAEPA